MAEHKHTWEQQMILTGPEHDPSPWNGPFECPCGLSVWLLDGALGEKPVAEPKPKPIQIDPVLRLMSYRERLERGEELSEAEWDDIRAVGEAMATALQPLWQALTKLAEDVAKALMFFLENYTEEHQRMFLSVAEAYYGKPEEPEVVELMGDSGVVGRIPIMGGVPVPALDHISINMDSGILPTHETLPAVERLQADR